MDFTEAEKRFQALQTRIQRGEPVSEDQYQEEMQKLMVQDEHGTFWSLEPGTGHWLYFDGSEWVPGTPPPPPSVPAKAAPTAAATTTAAATAAATTAPMEADRIQAGAMAPVEPDTVPAYVREGAPIQQERPAAIAPRPIRGAGFPLGEENTPWLPIAGIVVVLLLCALALFFGVGKLPFFNTAAAQPTTTVAAEALPTATTMEIVPTSTTVPSPTSAPTATLSVVTATLTDKLRVRAGPGTNYGVLATLDSGTTVTPIGRNADVSWVQIQIPGKSDIGWLSAEFLTISGDVNTLPVVQPAPAAKPSATQKKPATPKPTPTETPAG